MYLHISVHCFKRFPIDKYILKATIQTIIYVSKSKGKIIALVQLNLRNKMAHSALWWSDGPLQKQIIFICQYFHKDDLLRS